MIQPQIGDEIVGAYLRISNDCDPVPPINGQKYSVEWRAGVE